MIKLRPDTGKHMGNQLWLRLWSLLIAHPKADAVQTMYDKGILYFEYEEGDFP